jgi:hypothetical protein
VRGQTTWELEICVECRAAVEYDSEYGGPFPMDDDHCVRDCAKLHDIRPETTKIQVLGVGDVRFVVWVCAMCGNLAAYGKADDLEMQRNAKPYCHGSDATGYPGSHEPNAMEPVEVVPALDSTTAMTNWPEGGPGALRARELQPQQIEQVREALDRLFGDAGGCHDEEDALEVIKAVVQSAPERRKPPRRTAFNRAR